VCYTCGCKLPYQDHGDPRNVIEKAFTEAGQTKEIKPAGTAKAKQNMMDLIEAQRRAGELDKPRPSYAEPAKKT
jgi:hypothetical protein